MKTVLRKFLSFFLVFLSVFSHFNKFWKKKTNFKKLLKNSITTSHLVLGTAVDVKNLSKYFSRNRVHKFEKKTHIVNQFIIVLIRAHNIIYITETYIFYFQAILQENVINMNKKFQMFISSMKESTTNPKTLLIM